jgi:hypothetical protein
MIGMVGDAMDDTGGLPDVARQTTYPEDLLAFVVSKSTEFLFRQGWLR